MGLRIGINVANGHGRSARAYPVGLYVYTYGDQWLTIGGETKPAVLNAIRAGITKGKRIAGDWVPGVILIDVAVALRSVLGSGIIEVKPAREKRDIEMWVTVRPGGITVR